MQGTRWGLLPGMLALSIGVARAGGDDAEQPEATGRAAGQAPTTTDYRAAIGRTEIAPVIDGRLDDAAWVSAPAFDNFRQVEPIEGGDPSERTEVRLLFDDDNIYIAVRCFDREPERIIAKQMRPDVELVSDDRISVTIDTFLDRENGYLFETNPVGARRDALLANNRSVLVDWDGIWFVKAGIDEQGWVAEFRIPAKTVSFDPSTRAWGLNVERGIRRRNELIRWASPRRNADAMRPADAGVMDGLEGLSHGVGLDVKPFLTLTYDADRGSFEFDPGVDIFYKLSPATTAAITVNTDFAETEVDERIINLTRFPTFFPEKRDFFLQDEGIFAFGGVRRSPLAFFSRRIGIVGGEEKDILAGAKITGRAGGLQFGALDVQMKHDDELGDKNLGVLRTKYNWNDASSIGFIGTVGDPANAHADNGVIGFDYTYDSSDFDGAGNRLHSDVYVLQSFAGGQNDAPNGGEGAAFGARLEYPNEPLRISLFAGQIDGGFSPALGFVERSGEREFFGDVEWVIRPGGAVRRIGVGVNTQLFIDIADDKTNSSEVSLPQIEVELDSGDEIIFGVSSQRERLVDSFEINDGVTIPIGAYDFTRYSAGVSTTSGRPVSAEAQIGWGDFFDGHREDYLLGLEWRASAQFFLGLEYEQNEVTLQQGSFVTRIARARVNFAFSPDISWSNFIQYDNESDEIGVNSRLRWTVRPGSDVYLVLNQGFVVNDENDISLNEEDTTISAKVAWTLRF